MSLRRKLWRVVLIGILALISSPALSITEGETPAYAAVEGPGHYLNSRIADIAEAFVGQWGGEACRDAQRSGITGSTTVWPVQPARDSTGRVIREGDGQCRAFVNCIVWMASSNSQWIGGGGGDYFKRFRDLGIPQIMDATALVRGDIVQYYVSGSTLHTYIIRSKVSGNTYNVVDSNADYKETVMFRTKTINLSTAQRAFRMGKLSIQATHVGEILRVGATGASYLIGEDLKKHHIPDGGDFLCFVNQGHRVTNVERSYLDLFATGADAKCYANTDTLLVGGSFHRGGKLVSKNGRFTLILQKGDGNLVLYAPAGRPLWCTCRTGGDTLALQRDGNLVVYGSGRALWASSTVGRGSYRLVMQDDGNLVIYTQSWTPVWATMTRG
jgi:hypothetical protein